MLAKAIAALAVPVAALAPHVPLDPVHPCMPTNPCEKPQYCPDTGGFVVGFESCPSLLTGPYAPGGLEPNEGEDW